MNTLEGTSDRLRALEAFLLVATLFLLFLSSSALSESLYNRPIKRDYYRGLEIEYLAGTVVVQINSDASRAAVENLFRAHGCHAMHYSKYGGWALVGCDVEAGVFDKMNSLVASPLIDYAEPNGIARLAGAPNDPLFQDSTQWSLWNTGKYGVEDADIDALEAWEVEDGDTSIVIAVLDTGFPYNTCNGDDYQPGDYCHEDLDDENKYILGYDCSDSAAGCISVDDSGYLADEGAPFGYHGSMVTGIISAMTNNSKGMAGVIPECKIYVMKVYPSSPNPEAAAAYNVAQAMHLAVDYGAKIINFSAGFYCAYEIVEQAIERADSAKCMLIASVGNDFSGVMFFPAGFATYANRDWNCCDPDNCDYYPDSCGHRNVIAVGACDGYDTWENYSNYGTDTTKVTVLAPSDVISTTPTQEYPDDCFDNNCTGNWSTGIGGTSASVPHVTGVAGLLQSYALSKDDTIFTPNSIRTLIEQTADDLEREGWDDSCGFGRVNALRALMAMDDYSPNVTGYLRVNATWGDTLGDTLYVLGDVVIPQGCTLTIDDGAVIRFLTNDREDFGVDSTRCEIIVQGTLVIDGGPDSLVQFMSCSDSPSDSDWYGITVDSTGSIDLEYCVLQDAAVPIPWDSTDSYTMNHVTFRHCQTWPAIVDSAETLRVVDCTIQDFNTGVTVNPWGAVDLDSCHIVDGDTGILVDSAGSARFEDCEIQEVHTGVVVKSGGSAKLFDCHIGDVTKGINFANTTSDTVSGCTFQDNLTHGIYVSANDNLLVDDCTFVDSTVSGDSGVYGIRSKSDITITNSVFEGHKYGVKCEQTSTIPVGPSAPTIRECGFSNLHQAGIISGFSDPSIERCCFKGSYGEACIRVDGGDPDIDSCYMYSGSDQIPIGILFTFGAGGTVRRTTIKSYDSCAVQIKGTTSEPNFGESGSTGGNDFQKPDTLDGEYFFISECSNTIMAEGNYWHWTNATLIDNWISGDLDFTPFSLFGRIPYQPDICSEISGKIVVASEEEKGEEEEKETREKLHEDFLLLQNYPNPFNPETIIKYSLRQPEHVKLTVYNALGQKVRTLVDQPQEAGEKMIIWDGKDDRGEEVSSGVYLFRLRAGDFEATKRMVLVR